MNDKIKKEVMKKINRGDVKIRPRIFFDTLKVGIITVMVFLFISAVFLINFSFYLPKRAGAFKGFHLGRFNILLSSVPWLLILIGAVLIGLFIYIYRQYEGGYKKHLWVIVAIVSFGVVILGGIMTVSNINEHFKNVPHMKKFYQWGEKRFGPMKKPGFKGKDLPYNQGRSLYF